MAWAKFDDGYPRHCKVWPLSDAAFRLNHSAICWSAGQRQRGYVPHRVLSDLTPVRRPYQGVRELIRRGLWIATDGGWLIEASLGLWTTVYEERSRVPAVLRATIFSRDGWRCRFCGCPDDLTLDHVHPRSRGGSDDAANLQTLCRSCNSRKGARV